MKQKKIKFILQTLVGVVGAGIFINLLSNIVQTPLEDLLKENYRIFIVFTVIFIVAIYSLIEFYFKENQNFSNDVRRQEIIDGLKSRYKKRFAKKMDEDLRFDVRLSLTYSTVGTSFQYVKDFYMKIDEDINIGDFQRLFIEYIDILKRLLIVGEPGSGKTLLLLRFGLRLLTLAEQDKNFPVPIIINLSSWRKEEKSFVGWLEKSLVYAVSETGIASKEAKELAQSTNLLLLLDGLDEIPDGHRDDCLLKLSQYLHSVNNKRRLEDIYPEVIVCSRIEEYKILQTDAPVQATVQIQSLTSSQVRQSLEMIQSAQGRGLAADRLLRIIDSKPYFSHLLVTAFYVQLALKIADGDLHGLNSITRSKSLVKLYIKQQLDRLSSDYPVQLTNKWFNWLANSLTENRKSIVFELIDIQPNWLKKEAKYKFARLIIFAVLFMTYIYYEPSFKFNWLYLILWTSGIYFLIWSGSNQITVYKTVSFDYKNLKERISFTFPILIFLLCFLITSLVQYLIYSKFFISKLCYAIGLFYGIYSIISFAFFPNKRSIYTVNAYYRLYNGYISSILSTFLHITILGILIYKYGDMKIALSHQYTVLLILFGCSIFALSIFQSPLFNHFLLRFLLYTEHKIPWKLVSFLNKASEVTGLLEKDGGQWRFRHQLILEEFTSKEIRPVIWY